jgi:hypothetical protein
MTTTIQKSISVTVSKQYYLTVGLCYCLQGTKPPFYYLSLWQRKQPGTI